ncbi:MAG: glycosyltransferase family 4 protein [Leptolyngbyaceae cyanobacterium SL_7_1]|nr:glycosyltransferase family 4 protein [Leptolyngbyaceae cyanobacterium SL_7_1]
MKILVVSHTYIVDLNCEKFKILASLEPGIEVTIVVPKRWRPGGVQANSIVTRFWQEGTFRVIPIANISQNNQGLLCFGTGILGLLRQFRPDVIQVEQGSKSLAYAQLITLNRLLGLNAKNVFFTWWNLPYQLKAPASWLEAFNLRYTDGIVAGNQDGAAILRQRGYGGPISVMPQLGVDDQLFRPDLQSGLATQLGIQPDDFVVGFVGRFVEEKGLLTLCEALAGLGDRPWKWLLVGRGELKQQVMARAAAQGIGDRLIWVENIPHDHVARYINLMNVLVLPSQTTAHFKTLTSVGWKEQFGHVLIEAMAAQVPVIGSDSGEIPHVIAEAGLVFPEQDGAALRDCLTQLMTQPELATQLAKTGYDRVMTRYTNHALARQQLLFYKQLLTTKRPHSPLSI